MCIDNDIMLTGIVVGSLLPNVIALLVQPQWRKETRGLAAFGISVVAGLLVAVIQGHIGRGTDLATSVVAVLVTSQVLYQNLWRLSGIAAAIEQSTLPAERGHPGDGRRLDGRGDAH